MRKNISLGIFYYLAKFQHLVAFTSWNIVENVYCNCLLTRLWHHEFWSWPYLSNQAVFPTWPNGHDKNLNILRTKRTFKMKYKAFFIIFKGLSVKQITQFFLESESLTSKHMLGLFCPWAFVQENQSWKLCFKKFTFCNCL